MPDEQEYRFAEVRAIDGRVLTGVAMPYGERARQAWGEELFESRAFGDVSALDILLTVQHERGRMLARTGGGGLTLTDSDRALEIRAEIPETREGDDALTLYHRKVVPGFSVEFRAIRERFEQRLRIISSARLDAVSLVDKPSYPGAIPSSARAMMQAPKRRKVWR